MIASQIPAKIPEPFGAGNLSVVAAIPDVTGASGRASWKNGFTAVNMTPLASGGVPPFGQDMNGLINAVSAWAQWQASGGPVNYDAAYSTTIGGYPLGAFFESADQLGWWFSTVDNNTSNPDTGGANWTFVPLQQCWAGNPNTHVAGHAASGQSPPSFLWDRTNFTFWICTASGNAASAQWTPLSTLISVNPNVAGNTYNYTAADLGQLRVRKNSGAAMSDSLPTGGSVANGWWVPIFNGDDTASLTITAPTQLDGVPGGSIVLRPKQVAWIDCDAAGNFWVFVKPLPQFFAGEEIYVNASGAYGPGAYLVDTSAGPITFTLVATPSPGDNYAIRDMFGTFGGNPCTLVPGGNTILAQAGNLPLDVPWVRAFFAFKSGDWSQV